MSMQCLMVTILQAKGITTNVKAARKVAVGTFGNEKLLYFSCNDIPVER